MKQITKTPEIIARLKRAIGSDAAVDNLAVYEAIALNSRPLRKRSALYKGAIAQRSMLLEMALRLENESVPLQVQHNSDPLPIGRVFYGEVIDKDGESELRALFWVDKTHAATVSQIDNGTVDQVSVGVLPKRIVCSADGFDFLGKDAGFEHVYSGRTPDGHQLGENGVFARLEGLDQWFEMSLVGQGGAQNARIVHTEQSHFNTQNLQRLAASGAGLDHLALVATVETERPSMDLSELVTKLTATSTDLALRTNEVATLTASNTSLTTEVANLKLKVTELESGAPALAAANTQVETLKGEKSTLEASLTEATTALQEIHKKVLTATGKPDAKAPESLTDLVAEITEKSASLTLALGNGGTASGAEGGSNKPTNRPASSAFRAR